MTDLQIIVEKPACKRTQRHGVKWGEDLRIMLRVIVWRADDILQSLELLLVEDPAMYLPIVRYVSSLVLTAALLHNISNSKRGAFFKRVLRNGRDRHGNILRSFVGLSQDRRTQKEYRRLLIPCSFLFLLNEGLSFVLVEPAIGIGQLLLLLLDSRPVSNTGIFLNKTFNYFKRRR